MLRRRAVDKTIFELADVTSGYAKDIDGDLHGQVRKWLGINY